MREASEGDQEPERKVSVICDWSRDWRKEARISDVSSRSPASEAEEGIRGGEVVVAQVRRRLGSVARRRTEEL